MFNIDTIRADFPILTKRIHDNPLVYLDNAATTQKPQIVIDGINHYYSAMNSNIHRSDHFLGEHASRTYESVRKKVKDFIHAEKKEEIIFTSGTTESINLIAHSFGNGFINKKDEIIITEMEHHSNIVPWQLQCEKNQSRLKIIPINNKGDLRIDTLKDLITNKTKLISLTHLSNVLGTINPVKKIIEQAHKNGVAVLIDGAQAAPRIPINVQKLDCDFYVFSGHKLYAGTGVGIIYGKEKWLSKMPPYHGGGGMISQVDFKQTTYADIPFKFEAGTRNISGVISLGKALDYIENIGINNIEHHEHMLTTYAYEQFKQLDGITIYGNPKKRCGMVSFNIDNVHHYDAVMIFDKMGIALRSGSHCAHPLMNHYKITGCIRASFGIYNTKEEIDRLIEGIRKVQEMYQT